MTSEELDLTPADPNPPDATAEGAKLVPVAESIRYRRRAQQAEARLQQIEQQLNELRQQALSRDQSLAKAEAQRDEAQTRLVEIENRSAAERMLGASGVIDLEAASLLLGKRVDLAEEIEPDALRQAVEQLLLDKPFLRGDRSLPPRTASPRQAAADAASQLAQAARRAAVSGDRRDVAEYLRLRRLTARVPSPRRKA